MAIVQESEVPCDDGMDIDMLPNDMFSFLFRGTEAQQQSRAPDSEQQLLLLSPQLQGPAAGGSDSEALNKQGNESSNETMKRGRKGIKLSKWRKRQLNMRNMEQEAAKQAALAHLADALNHKLKLKATAMEYAVDARNQLLSVLSAAQQPNHDADIQVADGATLASLASRLHDFVAEASLILLQINSNAQPPDDVIRQLSDMVSTLCHHMGTTFVLKPRLQFDMITIRADKLSLGSEDGHEGPIAGHWQRVATEIRPTQQQLDQVSACWDLNHSILVQVQSDITAAQDELAREMEEACRVDSPSSTLETLQQRLLAAMLRQGMACRAMSFILFGKIFTPLQTARALVHSFPYFPNSREIITCLLAMHRS